MDGKYKDHFVVCSGGSLCSTETVYYCKCGYEAWGWNPAAAERKMDKHLEAVGGEFYPCKPDIFEKTYEPIEEDEQNG